MIVAVKVKISRRTTPAVTDLGDCQLVVAINEQPIKGRANQAVQEILSKHFKVAKTRIALVGGRYSKNKLFKIN